VGGAPVPHTIIGLWPRMLTVRHPRGRAARSAGGSDVHDPGISEPARPAIGWVGTQSNRGAAHRVPNASNRAKRYDSADERAEAREGVEGVCEEVEEEARGVREAGPQEVRSGGEEAQEVVVPTGSKLQVPVSVAWTGVCRLLSRMSLLCLVCLFA
jgi:hypothetical protein